MCRTIHLATVITTILNINGLISMNNKIIQISSAQIFICLNLLSIQYSLGHVKILTLLQDFILGDKFIFVLQFILTLFGIPAGLLLILYPLKGGLLFIILFITYPLLFTSGKFFQPLFDGLLGVKIRLSKFFLKNAKDFCFFYGLFSSSYISFFWLFCFDEFYLQFIENVIFLFMCEESEAKYY